MIDLASLVAGVPRKTIAGREGHDDTRSALRGQSQDLHGWDGVINAPCKAGLLLTRAKKVISKPRGITFNSFELTRLIELDWRVVNQHHVRRRRQATPWKQDIVAHKLSRSIMRPGRQCRL